MNCTCGASVNLMVFLDISPQNPLPQAPTIWICKLMTIADHEHRQRQTHNRPTAMSHQQRSLTHGHHLPLPILSQPSPHPPPSTHRWQGSEDEPRPAPTIASPPLPQTNNFANFFCNFGFSFLIFDFGIDSSSNVDPYNMEDMGWSIWGL